MEEIDSEIVYMNRLPHHVRQLAIAILYAPEYVDNAKYWLGKCSDEDYERYTFVQILRDATDFEDAIFIAKDDIMDDIVEGNYYDNYDNESKE